MTNAALVALPAAAIGGVNRRDLEFGWRLWPRAASAPGAED